ncbi:MAG: glycosyltransferase family 2 protein [Ignavibacteriales bacterium]
MPLFSVVIPLYNKEPHIQRTINSVLAQKIQDFEIIVVDDGSTDNSVEVIKRFKEQRIRLIKQKNAGVSAARNRGIKETKADLIAFLDADDEWTPSFLETVLRLREKYPEAGAYVTAYEKCDVKGKRLRPSYKKIPPAPWEGLLSNYFLIASLQEMPISTSAICIPKSVLTEFGGFQEGLLVWEDSELWGKIALKYKIAFSHEMGSIYHIGAINRSSHKKYPVSEHPFTKTALEKIRNNEVPFEILEDLKNYVAFLQILFAFRNIRDGNHIKAFKVLSIYKTRLLHPKMIGGLFTTLRHR